MTRNYSLPFGPIPYPNRPPVELAKQAVEGIERALPFVATNGKARISPPPAAEARKFERRANDVLEAERSLLVGHSTRLVNVGLDYAFAFSADGNRSRWYRLGPHGWRATTEHQLSHPRRDEWWHLAHSPIVALTVLTWTLRLWQARDDMRRLTTGRPLRAADGRYEIFDDELDDDVLNVDEELLRDCTDFPDP